MSDERYEPADFAERVRQAQETRPLTEREEKQAREAAAQAAQERSHLYRALADIEHGQARLELADIWKRVAEAMRKKNPPADDYAIASAAFPELVQANQYLDKSKRKSSDLLAHSQWQEAVARRFRQPIWDMMADLTVEQGGDYGPSAVQHRMLLGPDATIYAGERGGGAIRSASGVLNGYGYFVALSPNNEVASTGDPMTVGGQMLSSQQAADHLITQNRDHIEQGLANLVAKHKLSI